MSGGYFPSKRLQFCLSETGSHIPPADTIDAHKFAQEKCQELDQPSGTIKTLTLVHEMKQGDRLTFGQGIVARITEFEHLFNFSYDHNPIMVEGRIIFTTSDDVHAYSIQLYSPNDGLLPNSNAGLIMTTDCDFTPPLLPAPRQEVQTD